MMNQHVIKAFVLGLSATAFCSCAHTNASEPTEQKIVLGAEKMNAYLPKLEGKKVGLIVKQTSVVGENHTHLLDTLLAKGIEVTAVFAPEHGFRGDADAGEVVKDGKDAKTGVPIISLYGKNKKPSPEILSNVDILVFDIQDVGARFYTYISTMMYAMDAAAEQGKEMLVLDRPNPCDYVDGPVLDTAFTSFVGVMPIPVLHGTTVGELANMIIGEEWISSSDRPDWFEVVTMDGWQHQMPYSLPIKPSPNLPNDQAIKLYPSLCYFEGTPVSVGRGTYFPFQVAGYPADNLGEFTFTPVSLPGFEKNPLQKDKLCYGLDLRQDTTIHGLDLSTLLYFRDNWPADAGELISRARFFDLLAGTDALRKQINDGWTEEEIRATWQEGLDEYKAKRAKYLLYTEPAN